MYQNQWDVVKAMLRGKFIALKCLYFGKMFQISHLNDHCKKLEKKRIKTNISRRK